MTLGDIATKTRALTDSDTTSYPDANLLIDINIWYEKVVSMILESADESDYDDPRNSDYPILTTPMEGGQRDYSIPVSEKVLKIKRLEVTYDGEHYYKAEPIDDGEMRYGTADSTTVDQHFIKEQPRYDIKYNSIWLYPMPSSADADAGGMLRIEWSRNLTLFTTSDYTTVLTDSTVVPGFDDPFHPMLAYGAAFEFSTAKQLPQLTQITAELQDYENRLRTAYGRKELDRRLALVADRNWYK